MNTRHSDELVGTATETVVDELVPVVDEVVVPVIVATASQACLFSSSLERVWF